MSKDIYYVYALLDPTKPGSFVYGIYKFDYEPFYIGKGKYGRCFDHQRRLNSTSNDYFTNKVKKIFEITNRHYIVYKVKENMMEIHAYKFEKDLIKIIGRFRTPEGIEGPLVNMNGGGEGQHLNYNLIEIARQCMYENWGFESFRKARRDAVNWFWNKDNTDPSVVERRNKLSQEISDRTSGQNNPMYRSARFGKLNPNCKLQHMVKDMVTGEVTILEPGGLNNFCRDLPESPRLTVWKAKSRTFTLMNKGLVEICEGSKFILHILEIPIEFRKRLEDVTMDNQQLSLLWYEIVWYYQTLLGKFND